MSVKFNVVQRPNLQDPTQPGLYYPNLVSSGRLERREVIERMAEIGMVSPDPSLLLRIRSG